MTELATIRLLADWRDEDKALAIAERGMPNASPEARQLFAELLPLLADLAALIGADLPMDELLSPESLERLGAPADVVVPEGARPLFGLVAVESSLHQFSHGLARVTAADAAIVEAQLRAGGAK